ncbi:MAG: hypothetical protein DHS20C01_38230 [marine bacterium B5-7]|nr:MAG: hypothetical protein DHS20C01_38230 [marine bacterium B5-7]
MSLEERRKRTDQLRRIPLASVLRAWGAQCDRQDKCKWHTAHGTLSVTGCKFFNWQSESGGGGALDLVIELERCGFQQARDWLEHHFPGVLPQMLPLEEEFAGQPATLTPRQAAFELPVADPSKLTRITVYLSRQRAVDLATIEELMHSGVLYADARANAVFVLLGKEGRPVGAELRASTSDTWRGMASGSRKDLGYFSIAQSNREQHGAPIILCESAIDAISCSIIHPQHNCISAAGARPNPAWLRPLVAQDRQIYCGYDADTTGDRSAMAMIALHPTIQRLRPELHDWNEVLKSLA